MCTIVAMHRCHSRYPLVVAANRDEMYARDASPAQRLLESPRAVGGVDRAKGGSWLGATEGGFLVAVTNQRSYGVRDDALRSRGALVLELLARGSLAAAITQLRTIDARDYNAFNLLLGDGDALYVAYARTHAAEVTLEELEPGRIWILANDRIGSPEFPKTQRASELAEPLVALDFPELAVRARAMLADHEKPALDRVPAPPDDARLPLSHELLRELQSLCIHTPAYGTRSASLVAIERGRVARYLFADGAPCTTPFDDVTALLA